MLAQHEPSSVEEASMHAQSTSYVKRHPIRGALFGLGMGLGIAMILVGQAVIAFGTLSPIFVIFGGMVVGILYGTLMPAKGPKEPVAEDDPADDVVAVEPPDEVVTAEPLVENDIVTPGEDDLAEPAPPPANPDDFSPPPA
jgi:hypothetical protein